MNRAGRRWRLWLLALAALLMTGACANAQAPAAESLPVARIIVKPKTVVANGTELMSAIAAKLPDEHRLQYFRAMSGDAHVLGVVQPALAADVPEIIGRLTSTGLFEYVELDRMLTIPERRQPN